MINKQKYVEILRYHFEGIGAYLRDELRSELAQQGHKATGALMDSIERQVTATLQEVETRILFRKYGVYVEKGVKASRVPFGGSGGGKKYSRYIEALTKWVLIKRMAFNVPKARGIAFAIAKTHKKQGIPSLGSYAFSSNGRRKFFLTATIAREEANIIELAQDAGEEVVSEALDTIILRITKLAA